MGRGAFDLRALSFPLLLDENIHPAVADALRADGRNVCTVVEAGLTGATDAAVLQHAHSERRVVLTHDSDFGALAVRAGMDLTISSSASTREGLPRASGDGPPTPSGSSLQLSAPPRERGSTRCT